MGLRARLVGGDGRGGSGEARAAPLRRGSLTDRLLLLEEDSRGGAEALRDAVTAEGPRGPRRPGDGLAEFGGARARGRVNEQVPTSKLAPGLPVRRPKLALGCAKVALRGAWPFAASSASMEMRFQKRRGGAPSWRMSREQEGESGDRRPESAERSPEESGELGAWGVGRRKSVHAPTCPQPNTNETARAPRGSPTRFLRSRTKI